MQQQLAASVVVQAHEPFAQEQSTTSTRREDPLEEQALELRPRIDHVPGKENALADALSRMHCDPSALKAVHDLPAGLRVPTQVFLDVLPEFNGFLTIPDVPHASA